MSWKYLATTLVKTLNQLDPQGVGKTGSTMPMSMKVKEKTLMEPEKGMQQVLDFWTQELTVDHDGTEEMLIQDPEL